MPKAIELYSNATEAAFVHPEDVLTKARFTRKLSEKTVNGVKTANLRSEIILNQTVGLRVCESTCAGDEVLSARASISGSIKNHEKVDALVDNLIAALEQWKTDKGSRGFPVTQFTFSESA